MSDDSYSYICRNCALNYSITHYSLCAITQVCELCNSDVGVSPAPKFVLKMRTSDEEKRQAQTRLKVLEGEE